MKQNTRARGRQNGEQGVWPKEVEASFCLDFLDTFSSRKKFQYLIAKGKKSNFPVVGVTHQPPKIFCPLIAAEGLVLFL